MQNYNDRKKGVGKSVYDNILKVKIYSLIYYSDNSSRSSIMRSEKTQKFYP